jgi:hypothetical protein
MAWCAVELPNEGSSILGQCVHVVTVRRHLTSALATKIECDTPVAILERADLIIEHPATEKQAMPENYGLITGTLLLVVELCAIDI